MVMQVIFAHDHRFIRTAGTVKTNWQLTAEFWRRYLRHFDQVTVIGRDGAKTGLSLREATRRAECPKVEFELFPSLSSLRAQVFQRSVITRKIDEIIAGADGVIVRLPSELGLVAARAACRLGRPWAVEVAGCGWDALWNYGRPRARAYAPVMFLRMRRAVARAPFVLYVTRSFLQARYPNRFARTIACSNVEVNAGDAQALATRRSRVTAGWGHGKVVLGLIGTLRTRYKGIQTALAALSLLRDRVPSIELRVLGVGDPEPWQREALQRGVQDLVRFDGVLPGGAPVLRWLDQIDLYCQPSFVEGLPRALIEAMSRGLPAIGSTCGGIPELLDKEWMVRPGDEAGLANCIAKLVSSAQIAEAQMVRNWEVARQYDRSILDARRSEFWSQFASYCASHQQIK